MRIFHAIAIVAAAAALGGCVNEPRTYEMPVEQAFSRIRDVSYSNARVGNDQAQLDRPYTIVYNEPNSIQWRFTRDTRAGLFHDVVEAKLEAVDGNRTSISWEMRATDSSFETVDEERNKRIRNWDGSRRILREHVDSTLTGRPFDSSKLDEI